MFVSKNTRRLTTLALGMVLALLSVTSHAAALTISGAPKTWILASGFYDFAPTVSYAGKKTVAFQVSNKPAWLSFDKTSGRLSGTATAANVGKYSNIVISASVGTTRVALPAFSITVAQPNQAPSISGAPQAWAAIDQAYSFQPAASDPEGATLTFSIQNKPAWMTFSSATGRLGGTPTAANLGQYTNLILSVSDGKVSASLPAFTVNVYKPNVAPTISGTPSMSTFVGKVYSFKPTAADADGNTLTFSVQNKPAWASFNTATGLLSGTPTAPGIHANIVISVSDGKASVALPSFTLTVAAVVLGSATLHWVAPTENIDGTPLVDLAGFRVLYGTSPTALNQTLQLPSPQLTSVAIEELTSGTYYFTVKAYTLAGVESDVSEMVWKTIM